MGVASGQVKEALEGRALYVHKGEEEAAYGLISSFVLGTEAQPVWNETVWKKWLEFWLSTAPASFLGVVLSLGLRARPGPLGTFSFRCCPAALKSTSSRRRWSFFRWRFRRRARTWYG